MRAKDFKSELYSLEADRLLLWNGRGIESIIYSPENKIMQLLAGEKIFTTGSMLIYMDSLKDVINDDAVIIIDTVDDEKVNAIKFKDADILEGTTDKNDVISLITVKNR